MPPNTPYREIEEHARLTLDDEERDAIANASTWMVRAGIVGIAAALLRASELRIAFAWTSVVYYLCVAGFACVVLLAGRQLSGIRRVAPGEDFQAVERSLRSLAIVFRVKGILMLVAMGIFALVLLLPMLLVFF